jgi:hypothetical protein
MVFQLFSFNRSLTLLLTLHSLLMTKGVQTALNHFQRVQTMIAAVNQKLHRFLSLQTTRTPVAAKPLDLHSAFLSLVLHFPLQNHRHLTKK